jgi:predicted nucleotidyltransferase component of viral defense system
MNDALKRMLDKYELTRSGDIVQALREILQELTLLGLWRVKFFEKAAFYGGTALRLLYGLERFSEDLDFSLLKVDEQFDFNKYIDGLNNEILSFGFKTRIELKSKKNNQIQSAFLKADTKQQMLIVETQENLVAQIPAGKVIKIKIEIDTSPPDGFNTETKYLLQPIPFSVRVYELPDLFAGKMHAALCRQWKNRTKGRDWFDLIWYAANHPELNLHHLERRLKQTKHLDENETLTKDSFLEYYKKTIENLDINNARKEVEPFLKDPQVLNIWSKDFFYSLADKFIF